MVGRAPALRRWERELVTGSGTGTSHQGGSARPHTSSTRHSTWTIPCSRAATLGEIMPDIVSPLSATVFFPRSNAVATLVHRDVGRDGLPDCPTTFARSPADGSTSTSPFRRLADLHPGTSPEDIDRIARRAGGISSTRTSRPTRTDTRRTRADRRHHWCPCSRTRRSNRVQREHDAAQARRVEGRTRRDRLECRAARTIRVDAAV
jgi:hypothetical protein